MSTETKSNVKQPKDVIDQLNDQEVSDPREIWSQMFSELGMSEKEYYSQNSRGINKRAATLSNLVRDSDGDLITMNDARQFLYDIGYRASNALRNPKQAQKLFTHWERIQEAKLMRDAMQNMM